MNTTDLSYEQFVVIAETEWKLDNNYGNADTTISGRRDNRRIKHSMMMGLIEWNIIVNEQHTRVEFSCQNVADGTADEVHMELVGYCRSETHQSYYQIEETPFRHKFTPSSRNRLLRDLGARHTAYTYRILKDRSMFPDFTSESTVIGGRWASDLKLRVGDQLFHVNKQLLSMHSDHFDRMFNGAFNEANQEEVELKHEPPEPALFHDFLLTMCVTEALPNPKNVAALSDLASIYQAENVRDKCERHLWICKEIPAEERYMLAGENGLNKLQISIMNNAGLEESKRTVAAVSKKAFALTK